MSRKLVTCRNEHVRFTGPPFTVPLLIIAALSLSSATAGAGSIFDDDFVPTPARTTPPEVTHQTIAPTSAPLAPGATVPGTPSLPSPTPPDVVRPPAPARSRLAVPTSVEQARSRKVFKELFVDELKDRSSASRRSLASKLLAIADKTTDNATDRFVLLIGARDAAAEGGDLRLAARAAALTASLYDVDAVRLMVDAALKGPLKPVTPALGSDGLQVGLDLEKELLSADDYVTAARVLTALQPLAAGNQAMAVYRERGRQLAEMRLAWEHTEAASEHLKKNAMDPAANAAVGEFLCFVKGDFEHGLPALARSDDPAVHAAATRDLAGGSAPSQQIAIGDGWWDLAERAARDMLKTGMQQRAAYWYARALSSGQVTGLTHTLLEKRIAAAPPRSDGAQSMFHPVPETVSSAPDASPITRKLNDIGGWTIKQGEWKLSNGRIRGEGDSGMAFNTLLPSDFTLSFHMNVVSGMRPRIRLNNSGIMFGNEGYSKQLYPHGGKEITGEAFPYENGQELAVAIRFSGEQFAIDINGKQAFQGKRKVSESVRLELSGGDGWSRGTTEFWDFELPAHKTINLLALVDTSKDTVAGDWSIDQSANTPALVNRQGEFCRIQFPYRPPEEYDFRATFTYTSNGGPIILMCPLSDGAIMWYTEFNKSAFESRGKRVVQGKEPFVTRGEQYVSLVKVRKDKVQGFLNDRLVCEYDRIGQGPPALSPNWLLRDSSVVGLGVWASNTTFSKVEVVEVTGAGKPMR
jgi:hypothetical protein